MQLTLPWSVYCFEVEGTTVVDAYLEARGRRCSQEERSRLDAQRAAWLSAWEVEDIEPGKTLPLHDLLSGERRTEVDPIARRGKRFRSCRSRHHAVVPGRAAAALLERLSHRANGDTDIAGLPNTSTGIDLLCVALSRATETLPFVDVAGNDDRLEQSAELFGAAALCDLRVDRGQHQRRPAPGCLRQGDR